MNPSPKLVRPITCEEFEVMFADLVDGTLSTPDSAVVEAHRSQCSPCAGLANDVAEALPVLAQCDRVEAPPWIAARVLQATANQPRPHWLDRFGPLRFLVQPRWAMGFAMSVLSVVMLGHFWQLSEDRIYRAWDRTVHRYENLELVSSVQNQWEDWIAQRDQENSSLRK